MAKRRGPKRPHSNRDQELRTVRHDLWSKIIARIVGGLIRWIGIGWCVYRSSLVGIEWAGQRTSAEVDVNVEAGFGMPWGWLLGAACVVAAVVGVLYGINQARLRRQTIRHFEAEKRNLESAVDPKRSSSRLSPSGETPAEEGI